MTTIRDLRPAHDAIEVVVNSAVDNESTEQIMMDSLAAMSASGVWRLLCDFSEAQQHANVPQILDMVKALVALNPPEWRQAIIPPHDPGSLMAIETWEAACNNRGLSVKVFYGRDRDEAMQWLTTSQVDAG